MYQVGWRRKVGLGAIFIAVLLLSQVALAQTDSATCQSLVAQAITQAAVNCANRETGTACFAYPDVDSRLVEGVSPTVFDEPGERVSLIDVIHLRPQNVNLQQRTWGIITLHAQADLPDDSNEEVVLLGLGGLEIENGVPISPEENIENLTPMQSFYVRTGIDGMPCTGAPSLLMVQGPRSTPVEITANGVDIRIESTIVIRTIEAGEPVGLQMEIIVLSGIVTLNPNSANPIIIPPGFVVTVNLGRELTSLGIEGDEDERTVVSFDPPRLLTQAEIDELGILEQIPNNILNYPIQLPDIIAPSGTTNITTRVILRDTETYSKLEALCAAGELSEAICASFAL